MTGFQPYANSSKPFTRWWWFSGRISEDDIRAQLMWLKENGFGGVEIAWVYPLPDSEPGPAWLSAEWSRMVAFAKRVCDEIGLGCDFTFGSLWPFGGTFVDESDASKTFKGLSPQRLRKSWEHPAEAYILDHLSSRALERYSECMGAALKEALRGSPSGLFCDSWEVQTDGLWTDGFGSAFRNRYGYSVEPFMETLDSHPDIRYDYRMLVADYVLNEFYRPFTRICHKLGAFSRVQCHGSPTDLIAAYGSVDVPESEAILFSPDFSRIAGSAAALYGKRVVSCEAFTCIYGWRPYPGPGPFQGEEQVADLKLLADALFANGVNHIIWHGMPYNPPGKQNRFYASVHLGPDSAFAAHIPDFNSYMEKVSAFMKRGRTYSDVAVYMPIEDCFMAGELPEEEQAAPDARYFWEMRHLRPPKALAGRHPLWVSFNSLANASFEDGFLHCGDALFRFLYLDVSWLDPRGLMELLRLAGEGLPILVLRRPAQPGARPSISYERDLNRLLSMDSVSPDPSVIIRTPPLIEGQDIPDYWCRVDGDEAFIFIAHPASSGLRYPMRYGQSADAIAARKKIRLNFGGFSGEISLDFRPHQSLLVRASRAGVDFIDIEYFPPEPFSLRA